MLEGEKMKLDRASKALVRLALREDIGGAGDLSTRLLPKGLRLRGRFLAKAPGVLSGTAAAGEVFRLAAPGSRLRWLKKDGESFEAGAVLGTVEGGPSVLTAERTALNFLQRLCGVATAARAFAERTRGTRARVYDTRKTAPGFRSLDKQAVLAGGGRNHRMGLYDMVLLKDNHLAAFLGNEEALRARLASLRRLRPKTKVEIEAKDHAQVELAASLGAGVILLDNMDPEALRREIAWIRGNAPGVEIEVSGGVGLDGVRALAELGPDRISVGRITHSVEALDISLEIP
jgi:nicotinate-nucleotide pyrophosphorylase (carboxylating)